jgi:regulator of sirC expression with transglutaminase-like and TPR domain
VSASRAVAERWQRVVAMPDAEINLAEAALLIAAEEYPDLDVDAYVARIDAMAADLRRRLRGDITPGETLLQLNHYLFDELGFTGEQQRFYDPRNSFLNEVLDRRLGIPITLSIVYIEVGRRVGLALHGVSFPERFLVKCVVRDGTIVIDVFARGLSLSLPELQRRLRQASGGAEATPAEVAGLLSAAENKAILARVLNNLKGIYREENDLLRALSACERIIALAPGAAAEYYERGAIYRRLECFRAALADYRRYLQLAPRAANAEQARREAAELQRIVSRLN